MVKVRMFKWGVVKYVFKAQSLCCSENNAYICRHK